MRVQKRKNSEQISGSQRTNKMRFELVSYECSSDSEDSEMELEIDNGPVQARDNTQIVASPRSTGTDTEDDEPVVASPRSTGTGTDTEDDEPVVVSQFPKETGVFQSDSPSC